MNINIHTDAQYRHVLSYDMMRCEVFVIRYNTIQLETIRFDML